MRRLHIAAPFLLLALALCAGSILRYEAISSRQQLQHDEVITYLAAVGNQGAYGKAPEDLVGRWVPASAWRSLIEPGSFFVFDRIASDLSHYDNHPPLYFWLLHTWIAAFQLTLHSGGHLNVVLSALICLALFGFATHVLGNRMQAATVSLAWALSPATIETAAMARHYELFALMSLLFIWLITLCTHPERRPRRSLLFALAAVAAAGALTHYHFVLVVLVGAGLAVFRLARRDVRRLVSGALVVGAGLATSVVLNPLFYLSFQRQRASQVHDITQLGFAYRVMEASRGVARFFIVDTEAHRDLLRAMREDASLSYSQELRYLVVAAVAIAVAALITVLFHEPLRRRLVSGVRLIPPGVAIVLYCLFAIAGLTIGLYVAHQSPPYAMAPRYLAAAWPFMAFLPLFVGLLLARRHAVVVALIVCGAVLLPGALQRVNESAIPATNAAGFVGVQRIVADNVSRGNLLRVIWDTPADVQVFAAPQERIVSDPAAWLDALQPGDLFLAVGGKMDPQLRGDMKKLMGAKFELVRMEGNPGGSSSWYRLRER